MAKCIGIRCPMQYGYKIEECNQTDCPYRTEPISNADRIRSMSDEELAVFIHEPFCDKRTHEECTISYCGVCNQCALDWLQQPAEGEKDGRAVLHGLPG